MALRSIHKIHPAVAAHMPGLSTWRAMPTHHIEWLDPFLFLNHHGLDVFRPGNRGLPFGPHPHRGFETLTYILEGELVHQDSSGYKSQIFEGGVQWMTAGSGLLHSETSSEEFKQQGGAIEIIQLWLNLPSHLKMTSPEYHGLQKDELVHFSPASGVIVHLISGDWLEHTGPIPSKTHLTMSWIELEKDTTFMTDISEKNEILFYVVNGEVEVNGQHTHARQLVQFSKEGTDIQLKAKENTRILFGYGEPFNEPIVAQGPFVMNTHEELEVAYRDFQMGKMGVWKE